MNYLFETSKNENATAGNFFKSMGTGFSRSRYSSNRLHGKAYGTTVFINMDSFGEGNSCSTDPNTLHRCWNNHCNHHKNCGLSRQDFDPRPLLVLHPRTCPVVAFCLAKERVSMSIKVIPFTHLLSMPRVLQMNVYRRLHGNVQLQLCHMVEHYQKKLDVGQMKKLDVADQSDIARELLLLNNALLKCQHDCIHCK